MSFEENIKKWVALDNQLKTLNEKAKQMRGFYLTIELLKELLQEDVNVHTIVHGLKSGMDINKKNIFPLAHLQVTSSTADNQFISFNP